MAQKKRKTKAKAPRTKKVRRPAPAAPVTDPTYERTLAASIAVVEHARQITARAVNAVMTAAYWELGRYVVEAEQKGQARADYGRELVQQLAHDLSARFGRSFSARNLCFFGTLKDELDIDHGRVFASPEDAHTVIGEYIEHFYNRQRRHSTNNYLSPVDYEAEARQLAGAA